MDIPILVSDIESLFAARLNATIGCSGFLVALVATLDSLTEGIEQLCQIGVGVMRLCLPQWWLRWNWFVGGFGIGSSCGVFGGRFDVDLVQHWFVLQGGVYAKHLAAWGCVDFLALGRRGFGYLWSRAFVSLITGWVGFIARFIWHWGVWDLIVCVACGRIVWSEEIWCCWIGSSIYVVGNIGGVRLPAG